MNITPEKRADARKHAACVRTLRRWRKRKRNRPPVAQVVAELSQRYPNLPISRRSIYRWDTMAGDPVDAKRLADHRGGARLSWWTHSNGIRARRWWLNRGSNIHPTRIEQRLIDRMISRPADRRIAYFRVRIACAMIDLERRTGMPPYTASLHLIDCLIASRSGPRISRSAVVRWAQIYRVQGVDALIGLRLRLPSMRNFLPVIPRI